MSEANLPRFLERLGSANDADRVTVDFGGTVFVPPAALVALASRVADWRGDGKQVAFANHETIDAFRYQQRMNLFRECGYALPEDFTRRNPRTRFVPVRRIENSLETPGRLGTEIAQVIAPEAADSFDPDETGAFDYIEYSISELVSNVLHHSRGTGYVSAQYYPQRGVVRVGIADCGIGIRESFRGSPHWREGLLDLQAVNLALRAEVSSKAHLQTLWGGAPNAGVGLTLLRELSRRTGGEFLVVSGRGYYSLGRQGNFREGFGFKGTICAMTFPREHVRNFPNLLYDVKVGLGLIQPERGDHSELFQ